MLDTELRGVSDQLSTQVKRRKPDGGDRVGAHFNLNSGHVTVRSLGSENYGLVLVHTPGPVVLKDVEFIVREGAFENIQESGQREVCAYARGRWAEKDIQSGALVRYNPFERKEFFRPSTQEAVHEAQRLRIWSVNTPDGHKGRMIAQL